jgi:3-methyl-2-oxobutanoate hydroxymethyltransferase
LILKSKLNLNYLIAKKAGKEKISALTAYDYPTAKLMDEAGVDIILVGDSLGMVVLGYADTLKVTMEDMIHHTKAVSRAVKRALIVTDMPFGSYGVSDELTVQNALKLIQEGGAQAVKLEGGKLVPSGKWWIWAFPFWAISV